MKKKIEFGEIKLGPISRENLLKCWDNNQIAGGPMVKEFEQKWRGLFGYKYARALSSGTAAGTACCMALLELGAKPGDEVIVPALSFIATSNAVRMAGLTPVFVDVEPHTLNINEEKIEEVITPRTRAIKVVNTMGRPCRMDLIQDIARRHNLRVIVDNCEAYGCKYDNKYCLEYADMETASLYVAHIVVCGEGGFVSTNDPKIDSIIEAIRSHGRKGGSLFFDHSMFGANFKQTDLHAAIGLETIGDFWMNFNCRSMNLQIMYDGLKKYEDHAWFVTQAPNTRNAPHAFSVLLKPHVKDKFSELTHHLDIASIHWKRNFGSIPTQHRAFADFGYKLGDFPWAEYIGDYGLHIGCHRYLSMEDVNYVVDTFKEFFDKL